MDGWSSAARRHSSSRHRAILIPAPSWPLPSTLTWSRARRRRNRRSRMALLFQSSIDSAERWSAELNRLLPDLEIRVWPEIGAADEIDAALVWRPPSGLLASLTGLKLIAALGAGVDHVLADPLLPADVPIVRLVDPYMTA